MLRDVKNIPCLAFVPGELNVIYRLIGVSDDDDRSMVSNLIEIVANSDSIPVQTTISRQVQALLRLVIRQSLANITSAKYDSDRGV